MIATFIMKIFAKAVVQRSIHPLRLAHPGSAKVLVMILTFMLRKVRHESASELSNENDFYQLSRSTFPASSRVSGR
jgi:hypothetical protein